MMKKRLLPILILLLVPLLPGCAKQSETPTEVCAPISEAQRIAFANVAAMIETVFGETVGTERMTFDDWSGGIDGVYVDGEDRRAFEAYTAADTGEALRVQKRYNDIDKSMSPADRRKAQYYADQIALLYAGKDCDAEAAEQTGKEIEAQCTAAACALVEQAFAGERSITETLVNSFSSENGKPTQTVHIMVRMNEGACYGVTLLWPQMRFSSFSAYPLGWDACLHDYYSPSQAKYYAP